MHWRIGSAAVAIVAILCVMLFRTARTGIDVGFWYEEFPFTFSAPTTAALGGPLTPAEIEAIKRTSRDALTHAVSGLKVAVTNSRQSPWTVAVHLSLEPRKGQKLPNAGETFAMGPLGSRSVVHFTEILMAAVAHAPEGTTREQLIAGIGRGVGRVAVHELAHGILGAGAMDNQTDDHSYEYFTHNRPSQYFGELHWARAWPVLVERIGMEERSARAR
jgi:hypothetical protein